MNDQRTDDPGYVTAVRLIRDQLWHGHLTIAGLQRAHAILLQDRGTWPAGIRDECEWLLGQLDAELRVRELDGAETS